MDFTRIDEMAFAGYQFAAGNGGSMGFRDQLDIDAFNAGISNHNQRHGTHIKPVLEGMKITRIQGSENGCADKELAIVGA